MVDTIVVTCFFVPSPIRRGVLVTLQQEASISTSWFDPVYCTKSRAAVVTITGVLMLRRFSGRSFRMNCYPVPRGKFHMATIKHRHGSLYHVRDEIELAGITMLCAAEKDGLGIGRLDNQFRLEHPSCIAILIRFLLRVNEKQSNDGVVIALSDFALHDN
jgi:hypothetical protein